MSYPKILLRQGKDQIGKYLHPWIFSQALQPVGKIENGALADLYSSDGKYFIARGYYNAASKITFRALTRDQKEMIDAKFFEKRFVELLDVRERFIDTHATNAFRVIFGESDGLPGLVIDKYDRVFVMQIHTFGMERLRKEILTAMQSIYHPQTIFERSDVGVRQQEGLPDQPKRLISGKRLLPEIQILEHGIPFLVNVKEGQKTGFFLDQRENRKALQKYVLRKRLLNCFCYSGGFSVYAGLAGASETVNIDISAQALETAKRNFQLNKLPVSRHSFIAKDVFSALGDLIKKQEKFDIVILDPPAFVKNKKSLQKGLSGYLFINEHAIKLLPYGGILITSSCSAHVTDEMFQKTLAIAALRNDCTLKTLEIRHQPIDHPFNIHFPEGKYLKFYVMLKV